MLLNSATLLMDVFMGRSYYNRFRNVKFRLKYNVSVGDGFYILDLDLAALLPVSIKPVVRMDISSGYSYALLRER